MVSIWFIFCSAFFLWAGAEARFARTKQSLSKPALFALFLYLVVLASLTTALAAFGFYSLFSAGLLLLLCTLGILLYLIKAKAVTLTGCWLASAVKRPGRPSLQAGLASAILLVFVFLSALFPTNYLKGGRDYGLYMINGVHIATTGSVQYESDEFLNQNYEEVKDFIQIQYPALFSAYWDGNSDEPGKLDPQFLPMFSSLLAVGYSLAGFSGMLRVNTFISALCLLAIYLVGKRFFSKRVGLLAMLFLAVCPAQLWGARVTQSEQLAQLLFLLSVWALSEGWKEKSLPWALAGGVLLGIGAFNRIDNSVLLIALCGALAYAALWRPARLRETLPATAVATLLSAGAFWYGWAFHTHYYVEHWDTGVLRQLILGSAAAVVLGFALVLVRLLLKSKQVPGPLVWVAKSRPLCIMACVFAALLLLYAYFIRPARGGEGNFQANSLVEFCWYLSPMVLPFAVLGGYSLLRLDTAAFKAKTEPLLYLLLAGTGSVAMYTWRPAITPDHFWASRRWVPVNNPFLLLLAAAGIVFAWSLAKRAGTGKRPRKALGWLVRAGAGAGAAFMLCYMAWNTRLFLFKPMLQGIDGQYAASAAYLPDDAVTLTVNEQLASVYNVVFGKQVYIKNGSQTVADNPRSLTRYAFDPKALQSYLENAGQLYVLGSPLDFWQLAEVETVYIGRTGGWFPEASYGSYPQELVWEAHNVSVHRLTPLGGEGAPSQASGGENPAAGTQPTFEMLPWQTPGTGASWDGESTIKREGNGIVFYGPYTSLLPGSYEVLATVEGTGTADLEFFASTDAGAERPAEVRSGEYGVISLTFSIEQTQDSVEFVLVNHSENTSVACTGLMVVWSPEG